MRGGDKSAAETRCVELRLFKRSREDSLENNSESRIEGKSKGEREGRRVDFTSAVAVQTDSSLIN